jgi:hypothetical protein
MSLASLIKYNTKEMYGGLEINCHTFLTLATGGGRNRVFFLIPVNNV